MMARSRQLRRMRILLVPPFVKFAWAGMLILAIYINVVGWFAAEDLGDPAWAQYPLILLGFTVGFIADDLWCRWQHGVAHALHFEDVIDGVCPDTEHEICEAAVWRWYVKQGRPWRIRANRERPQVRFADAWQRMEAYQRAMERAVRNHRV
ncbi:hypothetical protein [Paraburkholderia phenazinium]|jgi:hypothetical protein|nr:hypothetical protein [Paraburkholderia phenazinium]